MISTMERDLKVVDGAISLTWKEFPNWYGIENIGFISRGAWVDPEIEYKGRRLNAIIVEETMWERYTEDKDYDKKFGLYMHEHADEVYELIELALEAA